MSRLPHLYDTITSFNTFFSQVPSSMQWSYFFSNYSDNDRISSAGNAWCILQTSVKFMKWKYMTFLCPYGSGYNAWLTPCNISRGRSTSWWRNQMETFSALLAILAGNSQVPGEFPAQRPVTRSFHVFFDLRLNKPLSKQSRGWWFETLSRPLWRHFNVMPCSVLSFRLANVCGIHISATILLVWIIHVVVYKDATLYPLRHKADLGAKVWSYTGLADAAFHRPLSWFTRRTQILCNDFSP